MGVTFAIGSPGAADLEPPSGGQEVAGPAAGVPRLLDGGATVGVATTTSTLNPRACRSTTGRPSAIAGVSRPPRVAPPSRASCPVVSRHADSQRIDTVTVARRDTHIRWNKLGLHRGRIDRQGVLAGPRPQILLCFPMRGWVWARAGRIA